jgi:DNA-binding MarR family transcriptional regulator
MKRGDSIATIERAMVRMRRSQTRRFLGRLAAREAREPVDFSLWGVVDAVEEGPDPDGEPVSVGTVAQRLGIDPSRASRVVSKAVEAGYVRRVAAQSDARRSGLELTETGRRLAEEAHRFRRSFFAHVVRDWPAADVGEFARLLTRFVDGMANEGTRHER